MLSPVEADPPPEPFVVAMVGAWTVSLGGLPKEITCDEQNGRADGAYRVLPNLLPLPAKSSLKQEERRANKVDYVIEI